MTHFLLFYNVLFVPCAFFNIFSVLVTFLLLNSHNNRRFSTQSESYSFRYMLFSFIKSSAIA